MARIRGRLVGRDAHLTQLGEVVARARAGTPCTVLIEADAGYGKSRLVNETLAAFRLAEDAVGVGYGVELTGGQIPYGTATELLRTLIRDTGLEQILAAAGRYAPALVPLNPELGEDGDPEATPARILPACATTVEHLAADRLVWLVVDDLAWVDGPTRDLLQYLIRVVTSGQLLVLGTVRTHDPSTDKTASNWVANLAALDGVDRVTLPALDLEAVTDLAADLTAGEATPEQVARLMAAGQGSPLLTEQLIAVAVDSASAPTQFANPMLERIRRLDPDTLRLVQLAALADGHLPYRFLAQAFDAPEATFEAAVDGAIEAGLLEYRHHDGEFAFTHPLQREAAQATLTPADRLRNHRRWGEVLSRPDNHHEDIRFLVAAAHHWHAADDDAVLFRRRPGRRPRHGTDGVNDPDRRPAAPRLGPVGSPT